MTHSGFIPLDDVHSTFEQVLDASTADETELVWLERRNACAAHGTGEDDLLEGPRLSVLVRVVEGGRQGWFRTDSAVANELENGVRQALALATVQPRAKKRPVLPTDRTPTRASGQLLDRDLGKLGLGDARDLLATWCEDDLTGSLRWSETHLAIFNSHGLRRTAATSEVTFEAFAGQRPGAGRATRSARTLDLLAGAEVAERARAAHAEGALGTLPDRPVPLLLSSEAAGDLLNLLNAYALAGRAYLDGSSFLVRHRKVQVFDRAFNLRDDATDAAGLPFPFDFEGSPKRALELVVDGQPTVLALNRYQGGETGLKPTAQAVGGTDALFGNLFLRPGEADEEAQLAAADGGIRVGWIDRLQCFEPTQLRLRGIARGARRIRGGQLAEPLPDFVWEDNLLRALARLLAVGDRPLARVLPTTPLGAISTPSLVLAETDGFRPV